MNHRRHLSRLLLVVAVIVGASQTPAAQMPRLVITGISVVDVTDGRILADRTVTVDGSRIVSVASSATTGSRGALQASTTTRAGGVVVVDGRGAFLIPGLWDMHSHAGTVESWLKLYVANGVTAIRDMGSELEPVLAMRTATATGRVLGPRIFAAGPILDDPPGDWPLRLRVKTAADGRAAVQLLARRGVDLIKVHDNTPRAAYLAIAEAARRQHLRLAGHVPTAVTVAEAIAAGQHDIEHLSNLQLWKPCSGGDTYRPGACRPFFEMLARRQIWQTPTLVAMSEVATIGTSASRVSPDQLTYVSAAAKNGWALNQSYFVTPEIIRELQIGADVGAVVTKDMAKAGVEILAGCDMMIAGFCVADELAAMVRGGMTPLAALQTATLNPARYFDRTGTMGSVAAGRSADLVLLDANPLTDIANVRRIRAVILAGRFLDRRALDGLLADVRAAAATP